MFWLNLIRARSCSQLQRVDGSKDFFFRDISKGGIRLVIRLRHHFVEFFINLVEKGFIIVMVRWLAKIFKMFGPAFKNPAT